MNVAYVRVSTAEQNEARQVEALRSHNIDKWFTEKISGKNTHRPQLQAMLDFVREGDTVYILHPRFQPPGQKHQRFVGTGGAATSQGRSPDQQQRAPEHQHTHRQADADYDCRHQ